MKWITRERVEVDRVACPWVEEGKLEGRFKTGESRA